MSNLPPPPGSAPMGMTTTRPPAAVTTAATLVYALLGLNALRTLLSILFKETLIDAYVKSTNSSLPKSVIRDGAPAYVAVSIIQLVIFGAIMVALATQFTKGKNWARIVTAVLCALGVIGGLAAFAQPAPTWYQLIGVLGGVLSLAIIVFLYKPEAKQFFTGAR